MPKQNPTKCDPPAVVNTFEGEQPPVSSISLPIAHITQILLLRLVRGGIGAIPLVGSPIVEMTFGFHDQISSELALKQIEARIDEIKQRLGDEASTHAVLAEIKAQDPHKSGDERDLLGELKPALELAAKSQLVSSGSLLGKRKPYRREGLIIQIGELEVGALFFPISFLRQQVSGEPGALRLPDPFMTLLEPEDCRGIPKWICVEWAGDIFIIRAYPKVILLDEAGRPQQVDEVTVEQEQHVNSFEYWPDGGGREKVKFMVDLSYGNPFELRFQEKGRVNSPLLTLALSYS